MDERSVATEPVGELEAYVASFVTGLRARADRLAESGDHRLAAAALVSVEHAIRGAESAAVAVVDAVDRSGAYHEDGHRNVKAWQRATVRVPSPVTLRRFQTARLLRDQPLVGELLTNGTLGVAQARELARLAAHRRVGAQLPDALGDLLRSALVDDYDRFEQRARQWEKLADRDGAHRCAQDAHADRRADIVRVGDEYHLKARWGVVQGEALKQVFDAFCQAEFEADRADAVTRLGDGATWLDYERTPAQRAADAVLGVFLAAAAAPPTGTQIDVCVDIVIDAATFDRELRRLLGDADAPGVDVTPVDPAAVLAHISEGHGDDCECTWRLQPICHTTSGGLVSPTEAVIAALVGHVRRVVVGADGVIINMGRKSRLFTGSSREAALLQGVLDGGSTRCIWPGCGRHRVEVDHSAGWLDGGGTNVANSDLLCKLHNIFKTRGWATRRAPGGGWHIYRPDDTRLTAA